ncbi:MAG: hypothetical protein M0R77_07790 [Gammaproteobacteria bacterium]|nr:hypothetical protein [Gammaproteobacteria bacterium]
MNEIKQVFTYLKEREDWYKEQIRVLQTQCPHENVETKRGANTDNWDYQDFYWVVVKCLDCGMVARYDSKEHREQYRKYC